MGAARVPSAAWRACQRPQQSGYGRPRPHGQGPKGGWASVTAMISAFALVVSYFSGPMLNFGDFSRYGKSYSEVKKGNFWGLPVNFLFFSLLVVCTVSAAVTVIGTDEDGNIITDPVHIVDKIDNTTAAVLSFAAIAAIAWYGDMELAPHLGLFASRGPIDVHVVWGEPIPFDLDGDVGRRAGQQQPGQRARGAGASVHGGLLRSQ